MSEGLVLIGIAILSAFSRGIISVIDRYQMGLQKKSIYDVNMLNNLYTVLLVLLFSFKYPVWQYLVEPKIILYSLIVQLVAMAYSQLFTKMTVFESAISAKTADLFIPIAVFFATGYLNPYTYIVAALTTIALLVWCRKYEYNNAHYLYGIVVIVPILVLQAYLSPVLTADFKQHPDMLISFTLATLYIRFLITFGLSIYKNRFNKLQIKFNWDWLYVLRALLTVIAQFTFILVTSNQNAALGWIFLNMTSLYGVVFSSLLIKEKLSKARFTIILLISFSVILQELIKTWLSVH